MKENEAEDEPEEDEEKEEAEEEVGEEAEEEDKKETDEESEGKEDENEDEEKSEGEKSDANNDREEKARSELEKGTLMRVPRMWSGKKGHGLEYNYCFDEYEHCDKNFALSKCRAIRDINKCNERPEGCRFRQKRFREDKRKTKKCCLLYSCDKSKKDVSIEESNSDYPQNEDKNDEGSQEADEGSKEDKQSNEVEKLESGSDGSNEEESEVTSEGQADEDEEETTSRGDAEDKLTEKIDGSKEHSESSIRESSEDNVEADGSNGKLIKQYCEIN